jgi:hypothetical protein
MNKVRASRQTILKLVEFKETDDDCKNCKQPPTVVKTIRNVLVNYGQNYSQLKKLIEISARLSPDDPTYVVEKIRLKTGKKDAMKMENMSLT